MTIEEFNNTKFHYGMKGVGHYFNMKPKGDGKLEGVIVSLDFDQALIAIAKGHDAEYYEWEWFRCENVKILE